jgi:hypothetical protein
MRHVIAMVVQRRIDVVLASFAGDSAAGDESRA